jgi:hypothetical protein
MMRKDEALTLGILALNTLKEPHATSDADFRRMDGPEGEEAVETLVRMRDEAYLEVMRDVSTEGD